jgi:P27 family predicted phage terminase small subunit
VAAPPPIVTTKTPMPKALSKGARRVWKRVIAPAIRSGLIHPVLDMSLASMFCNYRAEVTELDALIAANPNADVAIDPAVYRAMRARNNAADRVLRYAADLGLSPVGRLRLGHRETAPKTSAEDVRARLRGMSGLEQPPPAPPAPKIEPRSKIH